jgi:hypothetical protein
MNPDIDRIYKEILMKDAEDKFQKASEEVIRTRAEIDALETWKWFNPQAMLLRIGKN